MKHVILSSIPNSSTSCICSVNAIICSPSNQVFWWMSRIRRTCLKCELLKPRNASRSTLGERDERSIVYPPFYFFFFARSRATCTQMCVGCVGLRAWTALNDCIYSSLNREPVVYVRAWIGLDRSTWARRTDGNWSTDRLSRHFRVDWSQRMKATYGNTRGNATRREVCDIVSNEKLHAVSIELQIFRDRHVGARW